MHAEPGPTPVLILFAHPALERSRVNRELVRAVRDLPGVTFHDLYERYPDFDIDVAREQDLLVGHDRVVFQHPFFWYSTPAMLKEWQDLVLEHGWAYGHDGQALRGKTALNVLTAGGSEANYDGHGANRHCVRDYLVPFEDSMRLCGMDYLPPFVVYGTHSLTAEEIRGHAADYRRVVEALRDGRLDLRAARELPRLNLDLDRVLRD
jgi:glutathione-regulated potassium-efflux system ancillary protein KefG